MEVFYLTDDMPYFSNPVLTLGSYDGVHYGHRALLQHVVEKAREIGGESVVMTFSPHPRQVLPRGGDFRLLNTAREKAYLLEEAGIHNLVVLPFTQEFALMPSGDFVRDIMVGRIGMKWLVVGYDHRFGHDQEGDFDYLNAAGGKYGFGVDSISKKELDQGKVSSSMVRKVITEGDMKRAAELLTRGYILIGRTKSGRVIPGEKEKLLPPDGNYAVSVERSGVIRDDVLEINSGGEIYLGEKYPEDEELIITFE